ncbi:hypothetical protein EV426DRAFT_627545 [Tirmania nivea]|nr:hypothetical protein EV426DRAFT_627545 [Tirmania nivea]
MAMSTSRLAKCHPLCELMAALAVSLKRPVHSHISFQDTKLQLIQDLLGRHKTTMTPLEQLIAAMEKLVKEVEEEEERRKNEPQVGLEHRIQELKETYQPLDMEEWEQMQLEQAHRILDEEIEELELKRRMERASKMQKILGLELEERQRQRRLEAAHRILDREIAELEVKRRLEREQAARDESAVEH